MTNVMKNLNSALSKPKYQLPTNPKLVAYKLPFAGKLFKLLFVSTIIPVKCDMSSCWLTKAALDGITPIWKIWSVSESFQVRTEMEK